MGGGWMPERAGRRTRRLIGLTVGVGGLVLALAAGAFASTLSDVVPPNGTVAGQPYAYYLEQVWERYFSAQPPGPAPCQNVKVRGTSVGLVEDIHGGKSTCPEAAGHPIFVNELGKECSTIPGHHNGYGTSDPQLRQCARAVVEQALISVYVDGRRLSDFGKYYWKPTGNFSVNVPPHRFKGFKGGQVRAAAWGWSLLFKSLPKGTHKIVCKARYRNGKPEFDSSVTLHVG